MPQDIVLSTISKSPTPLTVNQLAEKFSANPASVSRCIKSLFKQGILEQHKIKTKTNYGYAYTIKQIKKKK